LSSAIFELN